MQYEIKPLTPEEAEAIEEKIDELDRSVVPPEEGATGEDLVLTITDSNGAIIAGCAAWADRWRYADLSHLWVDERYRNRGLGSRLFRAILRAAREKGCYLATVGLYSFQASAFCEKRGMTVYDTKRDCPKGYEHRYLYIRLDRDVPEDEPDGEPYAIRRGNADDSAFLLEKFYAYSDSIVPRAHAYLSFDKKITDETGKLLAGVEAGVNGWNVGYVDFLWTEAPYRRQGLGSKLLREAEREIRTHGVDRVLVSAFDWQGIAFFEKNGYAVTGTLDDFPKGHRFYCMEKRL